MLAVKKEEKNGLVEMINVVNVKRINGDWDIGTQ